MFARRRLVAIGLILALTLVLALVMLLKSAQTAQAGTEVIYVDLETPGPTSEPWAWDREVYATDNTLEVVTATVSVDASTVLSYTNPYTTIVEVPAGAVSDTTVITLTSLLMPRHPPTPPWIAWAGQAFELDTALSFSKPITATVHYYAAPSRWALVRWEPADSQWTRTPITLGGEDENDVLTAQIYQPGEFAVVSSPYSCFLPMVTRESGW